MIEAIREIGKIIIKNDRDISKVIDALVEPSGDIKGDKVIILNINIFEKQLEVDFEDIKEETPKKYLWFGTEPGNSPQIYFTTDKLEHLITQTIPNIINKLPKDSELSKLLRIVIKDIFYNLNLSKEDKYVVNIEKLGLVEKGYLEKLIDKAQKTKNGKSDIFKFIHKEIESKVIGYIINKTKFAKKELGLYTLKINNRFMSDEEEYKKFVVKVKIDSLFGKAQRICSSCNEYKSITAKPQFSFAGSAIGYYMTDKVGFSSGLSGEFIRNFILCRDCYTKLLVGEVFVRNKLSTNIGGVNIYIIPKFILPPEINSERLNKWAEYIDFTFDSAKSFNSLKTFQEKLEDYKEFDDSKNNFILNLLFYKSGQRNIKVLKLIKDVPPTRLDTLREITNKIKDIGNKRLGDSNLWTIDLQNIYYLIPLKRTKEEKGFSIEYKKILELYNAIFSGKPVSYSFLIDQFIELAQIYRFKIAKSYHITANVDNWDEKKWDKELINLILRANLFLLYLRRLNLLKAGGEHMDYDSLRLNEQIKNFLREMGYDEPKIALFLLGYLIGEIGNAQFRLTESHTKPILNKITFEGMNSNKLIRLTNEVFEKLNQYKDRTRVPLLFFNEMVFTEYKGLIDKQIKNWDISGPSDHESVFYVLSGYAYATHKTPNTSSQKDQSEQIKEEVKGNE